MSLIIENLEFYNSKGVRQAATLNDSNIWVFELTFEETSTGLFSTEQIHIMEKSINVVNNKRLTTLTTPKTSNAETLSFKFKKRDFKNFFMYRINYDANIQDYYIESVSNLNKLDLQSQEYSTQLKASEESNVQIQTTELSQNEIYPGLKKIVDEFIISMEPTTIVNSSNLISKTSESYINEEGIREIIQYNNAIDTITLNLGFISETRGEFIEVLELYVNEGDIKTKIAEISLFAESIAEDGRLTALLENFGQRITLDDSLVFRNTDVNDDNLDHIELNKKKKELILEFKNIIPYIGSYKGLLNAIKYYGYGDLKIKEWWLNLSNEKIFHLEIDKDTYKTKTNKQGQLFNNRNLKRTGKFSLFYDINKTNGVLDSNGIPELENVFEYSEEEVLIKLYGLKELLKNKYLPLSTRIVDITGEGLTFNRISTTSWSSVIEIEEINGLEIDLKVIPSPRFSELDILDKKGYNANVAITKNVLSDLYNVKIKDLYNTKIDNYGDLKFYDSPNRKSYSNVTLSNTTFQRTLQDFNFKLEDVANVAFDDLNYYPFYEMEWIITKNTGTQFYKKLKGNLQTMSKISVNVTSAGDYDVTVYLKDLYNNVYINRFENLFTVELPEPKIGVIYNYIDTVNTLQEGSRKGIEIGDAHFDLHDKLRTSQTLENTDHITFESLDPNSYMNQKIYVGTKKHPISELKRDEQYIILENLKPSDIVALQKQEFVTFINNEQPEFIKPSTITNISDINDTITITGNKTPRVGDLLEVYKIKKYTNFTLIDKTITIPESIPVKNGIKIYLSNDSENLVMVPNKISRNDKTNTINFTIDDKESNLYKKTFTNCQILYDFKTYEVLNTNGNTITLTSTIDLNLDDIDLTEHEYACWWNLVYGKYSVAIRNIDVLTQNKVKINLQDNERELFRVTKLFDVFFANYDIENSENNAMKTDITLYDLKEARLKDLEHINFDIGQLWPSSLTGFFIENWSDTGSIKIDKSNEFTFTSKCVGNVSLAIEELYNTNIEEFKMYNYYAIDANVIHAVSKVYGEYTLSIIEHTGGMNIKPAVNAIYSTNFPIPPVTAQESNYEEGTRNNRLLSNKLIKDWDYFGENVEIDKNKSYPYLYDSDSIYNTFVQNLTYSINGTFRLNNTRFSNDNVIIPNYTLVYFTGDGSNNIIGKSKYIWTIYDDSKNDILVQIEGKYMSYFFNKVGSYSIELEVFDSYGNSSKIKNSNMISTY